MRKSPSEISRRLIAVFVAALLFQASPAFARMYQWLESGSGIVRLSGDPPPWYRNGRQGPRTLVFENGRLIDDTAIELPREQEEKMRNMAFREVDLKREEGVVKKLERAALREARQKEERPAPVQDDSGGAQSEQPVQEETKEPTVTAENLDSKAVEQMKNLIKEWDKQRAGTAQSP